MSACARRRLPPRLSRRPRTPPTAPVLFLLVRARRLLAFRREAVLASPGGGASGWEPRVVEMQLARGEMEMEEAVKQWKQRGHLMALIKPELAPRDPLLDFDEHMKKFAEGAFAVRGRRRARGAAGGGAARARSPATLVARARAHFPPQARSRWPTLRKGTSRRSWARRSARSRRP